VLVDDLPLVAFPTGTQCSTATKPFAPVAARASKGVGVEESGLDDD
jgi:hypothetical protein